MDASKQLDAKFNELEKLKKDLMNIQKDLMK